MNEEFLRSRFEMLLPLAATWATEQEQKIVRDGVPLSLEDLADARAPAFKRPIRIYRGKKPQ